MGREVTLSGRQLLTAALACVGAALLVLAMAGCDSTGIRYARVAHAAAATTDLATTVRAVETGKLVEGNPVVSGVWPVAVLTVGLWGLAEWAESKGNVRGAAFLHWWMAALHAGASVWNMAQINKVSDEPAPTRVPLYVGMRLAF